MSISFLETFDLADSDTLKKLKEYCNKKFPDILVLMNINGCLCHRTSERINFVRQDGLNEGRFVNMMKHKRNFIYFREGSIQFLKSIMSHPRVKFAFYSTIIRPNIMPIILKLFENEKSLLNEYMKMLFD